MRTTADLVAFFRRQRRWTRDLVRAVPEDRFEWRPADDAFSAGELVRHLIQADVFWTRLLSAAARGEAFDPFELAGSTTERMDAFRGRNLEASKSAKLGSSFAELLERWDEVERRSVAELGQIPDKALATARLEHPLTRYEGSLGELMLVMLSHEAHHRGQLSAYLKMMGLPQPAVIGT